MTGKEVTLPSRSWAYPLYDLALVGWMFGAVPIVGQIIAGRSHIAAIIAGALVVVSVTGVLFGRRDGISVPAYLDSSSAVRVSFKR